MSNTFRAAITVVVMTVTIVARIEGMTTLKNTSTFGGPVDRGPPRASSPVRP